MILHHPVFASVRPSSLARILAGALLLLPLGARGSEPASPYAKFLESLFAQVPTLPVREVKARPQLRKGGAGYGFRTEIRRQAARAEANFAGEWVLVVVGCGTGCAQYFLVHATTGQVVDPHLMSTNGPPQFYAHKNLLLTGGSTGERTLEDARKGPYGGPRAWRWERGAFVEVAL